MVIAPGIQRPCTRASPISGSDRIGLYTPRLRGPRIGSAIKLAVPSAFVQIPIAHRNR
jgi:hypothetical protein